MVGEVVEQHARRSLARALHVLYPTVPEITSLIKTHVWRDRRYVGEDDGRVLAWQGLSANLQRVDARMRTVYVDVVAHRYDPADANVLFGSGLAERLRDRGPAIVTFVLDFPLDARDHIERCGFVVRDIGRKLHACVVDPIHAYLATDPSAHAARIIELLMLQRSLANQRRAVRGVEVRLQHLLHQSGFVAGYLLGQRLEVLEIAPPRRAGGFGHDIDARVRPRGGASTYHLGIEVYLGDLGYHRVTIPEYVDRHGLDAVMVIAPGDPWMELAGAFAARGLPARRLGHLHELVAGGGIGIHHLGLSRVIEQLGRSAETIRAIWPVTATLPGESA